MVTHHALLIIAGTTSGVGKTTISLAIMHALKNKKGLLVQPFKIGPDFIDPSYHKIITGKESRTLDAWFMGKDGIISTVENATIDVDIGIVEGVMGLFDGMSGRNDFASTAYVAKILNAPIILVVDASKAARSIAAMIFGYLNFDKKLRIIGIILNNVSGPKHEKYLVEACRNSLNVPILGIVKRDKDLKMDERHLGLIPSDELEPSKRNKIVRLANKVSEEIYYDKILSLIKLRKSKLTKPINDKSKVPKLVKIAVALDNSFNFYYNENLKILRNLGAEITYFSPISDNCIPDGISGIVLGGGFPEVMADKLNSNQSMLKSIKKAGEQGIPIYGECGGLMYLTKSITGYKDSKKVFRMVGIVDARTKMTGKLTLNYTDTDMNSTTFGNIKNMRGHEFHYSKIEDLPLDSKFVYSMKRGIGIDGSKHDGILTHNSIASYMHLHFYDSRFPKMWIKKCIEFQRK
ncbi:MAG TPA: cobyrinate a,c-diamide synthase [Nitrososphaeraceae archaeon]|nr:cobyrinate a,c-diamide synthase [Nitrososphaeraceae archaeon]